MIIKRNTIIATAIILFFVPDIFVFAKTIQIDEKRFITYIADPKKQDIEFYWKDDKNENFRSIQNLRLWLDKHKQKLVFAMNGGMYKPDGSLKGSSSKMKKLYQH